MTKKIHLVSANSKNEFGMEYYLSKAFKQLRYEVVETDYRVLDKQLVDMRIRTITDVDFLLAIKAERVQPESIYQCKIPTVLFMQDSIQANTDALNVIQHRSWAYNLVFTFDPEEIPLYAQLGTKAFWMPLAADPEIHKLTNIEQDIDIGLIGTLNRSRIALMEYLLQAHPIQYTYSTDKYAETINRTKINLNIGVINSGLQMRHFEVLLSHGFLLTNEIPDSGKLLKDGEHLVYFNDSNLLPKIEYYLKNDKERNKIAAQGRKEVLKKHTWEHRAEKIIEDVKTNL